MADPAKQPTTPAPPGAPLPPGTPLQPPADQASPNQEDPLLVTPTPGLDMTRSLFPLSPAKKR